MAELNIRAMAMKAVFTVSGNDYTIFQYTIGFVQETGKNGKPTASVVLGTIGVTIEATDDTTIVAWMLDSTKTLDGELNFYSADGEGQVLRKISFEKAWCVTYILTFTDQTGLLEAISIKPKKISSGPVDFVQ